MDAAPFAFAEVQVYGVWLCYVFINQKKKKKAEKTSLILRASLFFFFYQKTKTLQHETHMWSLTHQPMFLFLEKTLEFVVLLLLK